MSDKCAICGKFRKWEDLKTKTGAVDNHFSGEDIWLECVYCINKPILKPQYVIENPLELNQNEVEEFRNSREEAKRNYEINEILNRDYYKPNIQESER